MTNSESSKGAEKVISDASARFLGFDVGPILNFTVITFMTVWVLNLMVTSFKFSDKTTVDKLIDPTIDEAIDSSKKPFTWLKNLLHDVFGADMGWLNDLVKYLNDLSIPILGILLGILLAVAISLYNGSILNRSKLETADYIREFGPGETFYFVLYLLVLLVLCEICGNPLLVFGGYLLISAIPALIACWKHPKEWRFILFQYLGIGLAPFLFITIICISVLTLFTGIRYLPSVGDISHGRRQ